MPAGCNSRTRHYGSEISTTAAAAGSGQTADATAAAEKNLTMADTIESRLEEDAINGVQRVAADGVSVDAMSVDDRIRADQYMKQAAAAKKNHRGIAHLQMKPGGCG